MVCSEESMLHPKCNIDIHILHAYCSDGPLVIRTGDAAPVPSR